MGGRLTSGDALDRLTAALADRYVIERELGAGGMATVYLARDLRHERAVALKVLRPELGQALGHERFLREIKTTAQLAHPHILPLLDSCEAAGFLYYVMPFVEGESLRDRLSREKQLPLDEALRITRDVADALGYAHSLGVVHRDIKPENILFEAGHAVVADFGIARAIASAGSERLTETGLAIGTPAYMSPEQAAGAGDIDGRSDLYSLGCMLYEMLSGETPYTGPSAQAILAKKLSEPLPRISVVREAVVPGLEAALNKALARTPADRFATATAFAEALAHPETAGAAVTTGRAGWRRRVVRVGLAAAVLAAAGVAAALVLRGRGPALDPKIVAVAPFESQLRDTSLTELGTVAADWITQVLQGTGAINVVPTASVLATGWAPGADPRTLAISTDAGTVVTGRAWLQGDSVYLRADILNGRTGTLLSAVPAVAAVARQPLAAVTEIARRVGGATAALLDPEGAGAWLSMSQPPTSYAAYRRFAEALKSPDDKETLKLAQEAYALDTTLVPALTLSAVMLEYLGQYGKADSLLRVLESRRGQLTRADALRVDMMLADLAGDLPRMLAAAREMAQVAPTRSGIYLWGSSALFNNRPAEAIHAFTRGSPFYRFSEDASRPYGTYALAGAYHLLGKHNEELKVAREGRRAFPQSASPVRAELRALAALGREKDVFLLLDEARGVQAEAQLGDPSEYWGGVGPWLPYEAALELRAHGHLAAYRRAISLALDMASAPGAADTTMAAMAARLGRAAVLYAAERWDDARAAYAALCREDSTDLNYLGGLALSEAHLGHRAEAESLAVKVAAIEPPYDTGRSSLWQARIAAVLGQRDRAVALLRRSMAEGQPCTLRTGINLVQDCHRDMDFESLRGYAPFDELLRPKG